MARTKVARRSPPSDIATVIPPLLVALGTSSSEIYRFLLTNGITGDRVDDHKCPIANYLRRNISVGYVSVEYDHVAIHQYFAGPETERHPLPRPVIAFIKDFDGGKYSKLLTPMT